MDWPSVLILNNVRLHQEPVKNICMEEKLILQSTLNTGLALTDLRTTRP